MKQQVRAYGGVFRKGVEAPLREMEFDIMDDMFQQLVQGDGLARVSATYQRALKYGEEKIVFTISCACDQNEPTINRAGELALRKALELTDDGFGLLAENEKNRPPGT